MQPMSGLLDFFEEEPVMLNRRILRKWGYAAVAAIGAWGLCLLPSLLVKNPGDQPLAPSDFFLAIIAQALGAAWGLGFATLAFRAADEFQQHVDQSAWYWGALAGVAAS